MEIYQESESLKIDSKKDEMPRPLKYTIGTIFLLVAGVIGADKLGIIHLPETSCKSYGCVMSKMIADSKQTEKYFSAQDLEMLKARRHW